MGRHTHVWEPIGRAADFAGQGCELWRCQQCGKTWELFDGINPNERRKRKLARPESVEPKESNE